MKTKIKIINGVAFKRFKEINQTRAMWHAVQGRGIIASYDTLKECREASRRSENVKN